MKPYTILVGGPAHLMKIPGIDNNRIGVTARHPDGGFCHYTRTQYFRVDRATGRTFGEPYILFVYAAETPSEYRIVEAMNLLDSLPRIVKEETK